jgi:hypothetical protein
VIEEQVWKTNDLQIFNDLMSQCGNFESSEFKTKYIKFLSTEKYSSSCDTVNDEEANENKTSSQPDESVENLNNDADDTVGASDDKATAPMEQIFLETTV